MKKMMINPKKYQGGYAGWAALAGSVLSYVSAEDSADAAQSAADKSTDASKYSANIQKQEYDQTRQDQMPWLQSGTAALDRLNYLMGTGGGGLKTKEQLTAELTPKFSKSAAGVPNGALGMYLGNNLSPGSAFVRRKCTARILRCASFTNRSSWPESSGEQGICRPARRPHIWFIGPQFLFG
jgi:hypothetical protein